MSVQPVTAQDHSELRLGIDLGGTKIEAVVIDQSGTELERRRVPTPAGGSAEIISAIVELILGLERRLGCAARVGIGTPGSISPRSGLLRNSNTVCLNGTPFLTELQDRLGRVVRIANDANCFALSEAADGAAAGAAVVFGVILGTGVGGGVVVDGRPVIGVNAIGGELGHNPLPWPRKQELAGPKCYCGRTGCIETYLSGPALEREYQTVSGETIAVEAIATRMHGGEEWALAVMADYLDRLARSLASVINILDPEIIVIGGGLSNIELLYEEVPKLWDRYVFSDVVGTRLLRARHGDSSGVRGAAWLWPPTGL
jgi:fructokinase